MVVRGLLVKVRREGSKIHLYLRTKNGKRKVEIFDLRKSMPETPPMFQRCVNDTRNILKLTYHIHDVS